MSTSSAVSLILGMSGIEDAPILYNPEVSFWRSEKPRHTHFCIDYMTYEHPSPQWGKELSFDLVKNVDLIRRQFIVTTLPAINGANSRYIDDLGRGMFEYVKLTSGGGNTAVNTLYPELEHALEELQVDPQNQWGQLTGRCDTVAELIARSGFVQTVWFPLNWSFTLTDGDAFPYVNMVGSGLTIKAKVRPFLHCTVTTIDGVAPAATEANNQITKMVLLTEAIQLNDEERTAFSNAPLMRYSYVNNDFYSQTMAASVNASTVSVELQFNHPVKDIIFMFRQQIYAQGGGTNTSATQWNNWANFVGGCTNAANPPFQDEAFLTCQLKLNGSALWEAKDPHFFRKYLALTRYGRIPRKQIYPLPAALYPNSDKFTGHINLSKVDKRHLVFTLPANFPASDLLVYTRHYNEMKLEKHTLQVLYA